MLNRKRAYGLHFDSSLLSEKNIASEIYSLYPYKSTELKAVFVYGTDYSRAMNLNIIAPSTRTAAGVILLFIWFAAITLCVIRQKLGLSRAGFITSFIDCLIPFIGGGNIRVRHKFEGWFFGVLIFSAFLIMSVLGGDLVDSVIQIINSKISKFEQLAETNSTVYINQPLKLHSENIHSMLM